MKLIILVFFSLTCLSVASGFPEDPPGVDVLDREFLRAYPGGEEVALYVTLFNFQGRATVRIDEYRNGEWEMVCKWHPRNLGDEFMTFDPISVLSIFDLGEAVQVSWIDTVEYHEGMVSFYVLYDYLLGETEEGWID